MRSTVAPVLLILLAACGNPPEGQPPSDDTDTGAADTGTTIPVEPPTWQVSGQVGQVFVVNQARGVNIFPNYGIHAMFADSLQGLATAPWCAAGGPCIASLPSAGGHADSEGSVDPAASTWSWNGHDMAVGSLEVPFSYNPSTGLAWYSRTEKNIPDTSPIPLVFDGEWGPYTGEVVIPEPLVITSPDPDASVPLVGTIPFRWTPTGADDVYLRVKSGDFDRLWHLEDDGEFDLDVDALDLGADGAVVTMALERWNVQTIDVNGNELTTVGVWSQPYSPLICDPGDYPTGTITASGSPQQPLIDPASVSVGFFTVIDDEELYDYWLDEGNDGSNQLFSAMMTFDFYDADDVHLCTIVYDASNAVHVGSPTPAAGGGAIFDAWEMSLSNGNSNCTALDVAVWGKKDLREILQQEDWGFGIGTVSSTEAALASAYDWAVYEPVTAGAYVKLGGEWHEVGGTLSVGMKSCGVVDPDLLALPKPTSSPLPTRYYLGLPVVSFPLGG